MTTEMIIKELQYRGFNAKAHNVVKNGVELEGIIISNDSPISPVIYTETILKEAKKENKALEEVVTSIITLYVEHKDTNFKTWWIHNEYFIMNNLYIGLQKSSNEVQIIKRACEDLDGIESYLYVRTSGSEAETYSFKITPSILDEINISEAVAWDCAIKNTFRETSLTSLAHIVSELAEMEYSPDLETYFPLYVLSNKCKVKGASAILNKQVLADFGTKHNVDKILVLPSSIHEMLIAPYTADMDIDEFSSMVTEINHTQVDPTERLTDTAYILSLA